jgi:hypothetical protein
MFCQLHAQELAGTRRRKHSALRTRTSQQQLRNDRNLAGTQHQQRRQAIRIRPPLANSISITPGVPGDDDPVRSGDAGDVFCAFGATVTGLNVAGTGARSQSCCRQRNN